MDFFLDPETEKLKLEIRNFVSTYLLPLENDPNNFNEHENIHDDLLSKMREKAQSKGLWALSMPIERGGRGIGHVGMAVCYEEMNRSIFGPVVFNAAAPDDGNMYLLNKVASENQKEKWLQPIISGEVRSSIVMTEPHPGGGSDPAGMMLTHAEKTGGKWLINGRKWFITGAKGASHFILLARTSTEPRRNLTAFLFHKDDPGWEIVRRIPIMGPEEHGGHCELVFKNFEIPDENRLMGVGEGMKCVQIRLGTARLTHCMRWLGMAKRSLELAAEYIEERKAFGSKLADRESIQILLGAAATKIYTGRLLTMYAAWSLDQGRRARKEVSIAKASVADILHESIDIAIQLCGARGYSKDMLLEWMYRYARQARIVDGASEVHMMVLAKYFREEGLNFWEWG